MLTPGAGVAAASQYQNFWKPAGAAQSQNECEETSSRCAAADRRNLEHLLEVLG